MDPALVALDIQALQQGSGAGAARARRVADLAGSLARSGRLAAALIAPEMPVPAAEVLPPELRGAGGDLIRWDHRATTRELVSAHPRLVYVIPAPLLHTGPGDLGGLIVARHWADAPAPRVVVLERDDIERLTGAATPLGPLRESRLTARLEWIRTADRIEVDQRDTRSLRTLGIDPSRVVSLTREESPGTHEIPRARRQGPPALPYRLAVFGPFPPGGGGIGAYNARFVEAVAASGRARVDAVTTTGMGWDPPHGVGLIHAESFGTDVRPASYDWVIYTLGNSDGHLPTVEAALRHPGWLWLHEARLPAVATTALASFDDEAFAELMSRLLERAYPGRPPLPAARSAGRSHLALADAGVGLTGPLAERAAGIFVNSTAALHALELDLPPLAWRPPTVVLPPACPEPPEPPEAPEAPQTREAAEPPTATEATPAGADERCAPQDLAVAFGLVSMGKRPDLLVDAAALSGCRLAFVGPCPTILQTVIRDRAAARGIADRVEVTGRLDDAGYWAWLHKATVAVQLRDSAGGEMSASVLDALAAGVPVVTNLASAADYPAGTLELLEEADPTAAALAATLEVLLGPSGQARRAALSAAGRRFAQTHQMRDLARAVITALQTAAQ